MFANDFNDTNLFGEGNLYFGDYQNNPDYTGNPFYGTDIGPNDPPPPVPDNNGSGGGSNPFDPYNNGGYGTTGENNYVPPGSNTNDPNLIPINSDPSVIGSSTYDPFAGLTPNNNIPINQNDGVSQGGGMPGGSGGGGGIFGGNAGMGTPIPLPVSPGIALGASILLSNGNLLGGGGPASPGQIATNVGNAVTNPGGALSNVGDSISNIMGPTTPAQGAGAASIIPIAFPGNDQKGTGGGLPATSGPVIPGNPTDNTKNPAIAFPGSGSNPNPVGGTDSPPQTNTVIPTGAPGPAPGNPVTAPGLPRTEAPTTQNVVPLPPGPAPSNPVSGADAPAQSSTVIPTPPGPAPTNPQTETQVNPPATVVPVNPVTGGGGATTTNPVITPTVPTPDTSVVSPLDRNFYNEGNQSTNDLQRLLSGIMGNYGSASGAAEQTDFTNWQNILSQFGAQNQNLTGQANAQTQAANTALRTNNLNDVQNLLPQATAIRNSANPGLLGDTGSLQNYSNGAASFLAQAQQQQNDANFLSPQEMNTAQQAARNAWSARGLVNSPGAVGAEILNTDAALRGRQQQAFQNTGSALGAYGQAVNAQQQGQFDPFNAILGSSYGQQTNNAGSNSNLYGQSSAFSSGAQGDQYAQGISNPFQPYAQDVYNSNFNGANARNISASNNAAAVAGANTAQSSALANSFLRLFGQYMSGSCWVARSVFGVDDPRWMQFRYWMLNIGPTWFRKLYLKHGEKFALWLDRNPWLKPKIKELMEARIKTLSPKDRALSLIEISRPEIRPIIVALAYGKHLNLQGGY